MQTKDVVITIAICIPLYLKDFFDFSRYVAYTIVII